MGAILASMPAVETHVVAFNHEDVVDLTEHCTDPVDLLFGVQLGGAEDYWKATCYCERFMHTPAKTLYILLADLHDTSPNENRFVKKMEFLLESGVKAVALLAISDQGQPSYNDDLAETLAKLGMPCFGCTPDRLPDLLAAVLKGSDLRHAIGLSRRDFLSVGMLGGALSLADLLRLCAAGRRRAGRQFSHKAVIMVCLTAGRPTSTCTT